LRPRAIRDENRIADELLAIMTARRPMPPTKPRRDERNLVCAAVSITLASIQVQGLLAFLAVISAHGAGPAMNWDSDERSTPSHLFHDAAPLQYTLTNTYSI
jgi:hypothetical protein